jgi:hypothetical protein
MAAARPLDNGRPSLIIARHGRLVMRYRLLRATLAATLVPAAWSAAQPSPGWRFKTGNTRGDAPPKPTEE